MDEIQLTKSEKIAKVFFHRLILEAFDLPCDKNTGSNYEIDTELPIWYDADKFKRAQQFYQANRVGILEGSLSGLLLLLAETKSLQVLMATNKSSCPYSARKRYFSTILHVASWYESDLAPGSKSWCSLTKVRKMHLASSELATSRNIGSITQAEIALTTFGFMGFALIRPHLLGINFKSIEDRQAFVHFWAIIGHMIGVQDRYNICLFDYDIVEIICKIMLRYMFMPLIQIETNEFRQMVNALTDGLATYLPFMSYDVQIFKMRRITGIPGYQYNVDRSKEIICRQIFSKIELNEMQAKMMHCHGPEISTFQFLEKIPLIDVNCNSDDQSKYLIVDSLNSDNWLETLNDKQFWKLSRKSRRRIKIFDGVIKFYEYRIGQWFIEMAMSLTMVFLRRFMRIEKK